MVTYFYFLRMSVFENEFFIYSENIYFTIGIEIFMIFENIFLSDIKNNYFRNDQN